jgi:hypothetical protein
MKEWTDLTIITDFLCHAVSRKEDVSDFINLS